MRVAKVAFLFVCVMFSAAQQSATYALLIRPSGHQPARQGAELLCGMWQAALRRCYCALCMSQFIYLSAIARRYALMAAICGNNNCFYVVNLHSVAPCSMSFILGMCKRYLLLVLGHRCVHYL